jgi:hypothetical protein
VELLGCEYAGRFADVAQQAGINVRHGGIETLVGIPPPDVLIMSHVLEHFADPNAELQRIRSLIGPKTLVYVEVPGVLTLHKKAQYEYDLLQYLTLAHTYHFTLATLRSAMRRVGFRLVVGDEEVRSVFVEARPEALASVDVSADADAVIGYLASLDHSAQNRFRRATLHVARMAERSLKAAARGLFGERGVEVVRQLRQRTRDSGAGRDA